MRAFGGWGHWRGAVREEDLTSRKYTVPDRAAIAAGGTLIRSIVCLALASIGSGCGSDETGPGEFACYNASTCDQTGLTPPVLDYTHSAGGCSVTGGYVYRGTAIPGLSGHYLYSDYCNRYLKSFRYSSGAAVDPKDWGITAPGNVTSFGVDHAGEVYIIAGSGIYKIVAGS